MATSARKILVREFIEMERKTKEARHWCLGCQREFRPGARRLHQTNDGGWCSERCWRFVQYLEATYGDRRYAAHELRNFILWRDGNRCAYCKDDLTGRPVNMEHVTPWPEGRTTPSNLVPACRDCNKQKYTRRGLRIAYWHGRRRIVLLDPTSGGSIQDIVPRHRFGL